jgi:hypothetical protein
VLGTIAALPLALALVLARIPAAPAGAPTATRPRLAGVAGVAALLAVLARAAPVAQPAPSSTARAA